MLLCCGVVVLWCFGVVVLWCCGVVVFCVVVLLCCCGVVVLWCCGVVWCVSCGGGGGEGCSRSWVRPFGCSPGRPLRRTPPSSGDLPLPGPPSQGPPLPRTAHPKKKNNYNYNYNCIYIYNRNDNCNYICRCHNQCQLWEGTRVLTFWKVTGRPTLLGGGDRSGGFWAAGASHDSPRTPNVHISGPWRFKHHQNSTRRPPEREERVNICGGREKKKREILGPTPRGPIFSRFGPPPFGASTLRGPTLRGPPCLPTTDAPRTHFFQFLLVSCVVLP